MKVKTIFGLFVCLNFCFAALLIAGEREPDEKAERIESFVVMTTQGLHTNLVSSVAEHLSDSYHGVPFEVSEKPIRLSGSPEDMAGKIGIILKENQKGAIVLVNRHWKENFKVGVFKDEKVVFLNVWSLRLRKMDDKIATAKYEKRVKKEAVMAIGLLIGLQPTPFPRCAMCPWNTEAELDKKGLNLSPPNHVEAKKLLKAMGFELDY